MTTVFILLPPKLSNKPAMVGVEERAATGDVRCADTFSARAMPLAREERRTVFSADAGRATPMVRAADLLPATFRLARAWSWGWEMRSVAAIAMYWISDLWVGCTNLVENAAMYWISALCVVGGLK